MYKKHLSIKHLPSASGLFLVKLLPYIPILGNVFPNRSYRFLIFGNIYFKEGYERELFNLMEALLRRHQLNFGMIYIDKRSPVYQRLKSAGRFGVFNTLVDIPVHVMACLKGFTENEIYEIRKQPLFISMMDPVENAGLSVITIYL